MQNITIRMDVDTARELRYMARLSGVSVSALLRRGVDMAIADMGRRLEAMEIGLRAMEKRDGEAGE